MTKTIKKIPNMGKFIKISPGTFMMGSPTSENGRFNDEVQHEVTLTKDFEMGTTQVTQKQWARIMGNNPSRFKGDRFPVESVSWDEVQDFLVKLNQSQSKWNYRLPTEAEWEYSARAGSTSAYCFGDDVSKIKNYGWVYENSNSKTHEVGKLIPNRWGLYDMHGNVWEWTQDRYGPLSALRARDPVGCTSGSDRVLRGGGWSYDPRGLRSARRGHSGPGFRYSGIGFRLVRTPRISLPSYALTLEGTEAAKRAKVLEKISEVKNLLGSIEELLN